MTSFSRFSDLIEEKRGSNVCRGLIEDGMAELSKIACPFVRETGGTLLLSLLYYLEGCCPLIFHKHLYSSAITSSKLQT